MSTFLFLLIRSLQILSPSAYSFAVHCSPLWFMFVLEIRIKKRMFVQFLKTVIAICGSTTYSTWVGTDVLFDIRILKTIGHGKNRLLLVFT